MKTTEDLLVLINETPRIIPSLDWAEETEQFSKERMTKIIHGINDDKLRDDVISLIISEWDLLAALHDDRCYEQTGGYPTTKFTVEDDVVPFSDGYDNTINAFLSQAKENFIEIRQKRAKHLKVRQDIMGRLDSVQHDTSSPEVAPDIPSPIAVAKGIESLLVSCARCVCENSETEQKAGEIRNSIQVLLEEVKARQEALNKQLQETVGENQRLKEQNKSLSDELSYFLEPPQLSEEDLEAMEQASREIEEYQQAELDKMLSEAKNEIKRNSVLISDLIQKVKDIPDYTRQLDAFHLLSELLSDNPAWLQVSGRLIVQINEMQRERTKLQLNINDARFESFNKITGNQSVTIG